MLERVTWFKQSGYRWAGDDLTVYIDPVEVPDGQGTLRRARRQAHEHRQAEHGTHGPTVPWGEKIDMDARRVGCRAEEVEPCSSGSHGSNSRGTDGRGTT